MGGFKIERIDKNVQKLIQENNMDKNNDGLINDDNGELADLLSKTGKSSAQQLNKFDSNFLWPGLLTSSGLLAGSVISFDTQMSKDTLKNREALREMLFRPGEYATGEEIKQRVNAVIKKSQNFKPAKKLFIAGSVALAITLTCSKIFGSKYVET